MLNFIWGAMIALSVVVAAINGNLADLADAIMNGAAEAVKLTFSLMGVMCLWTGMMKIASECGIIRVFSVFLRPVTKLLFPKVPYNSAAMDAMVMNITANIFGMSNAATPLGIKATNELAKGQGSRASDAMCMFIVLNTASVQLIPSTILALRNSAGSGMTYAVVLPIWAASITSLLAGVLAARLFAKAERRRK